MNNKNNPLLQARQIAKSYHDGQRELQVLRQLDLQVQPGEVVAIVGQSGSGKSTLLHLLGGLDRPDAGQIHFQGHDIATLGQRRLNRLRGHEIGFVFQFHHLLPELNALENVAMPLRLARVPAAKANQRAKDILAQVGLDQRGTHISAKLSGGEQQRVALARALVHDPTLVLADEPTGNLDPTIGEQVIDLLWSCTRDQNRALVIVTHETQIADRAHRKLRLQNGQLHPA